MKVSIITVVFNAEDTIAGAIASVAKQQYTNIEHIVIDGASTDTTLAVIKANADSITHIISEPDTGIYDAMNKGIRLASGDVIGLLNADDVYQHNDVISEVVVAHQDPELDACYSDLVYVKADDLSEVTRYWRSREHVPGLCFKGWMPAHPTLFLKAHVYEKVGLFNTTLDYQSDLEFCARAFEVHSIRSRYISNLWVRMRLGGVTNGSLKTMILGNWESYLALRKLGLKRNPVSYFLIKFGAKIPQFFNKESSS
jgi:glycosyltransferase involved in cell wall biosynthesis